VKRSVIVACVLAAALPAVATVAWAGSSPIVRPADERGLSQQELGAQLFAANCAACHGIDGRGVTGAPQQGTEGIQGLGPSLLGVGAQAADFYTRTGYMPLGDPQDQPVRSRVLFSDRERQAIVRYIASLAPGPGVPDPQPAQGSVAEGRELFTEHCAGCHQVVAEGGIMPGAKAPPLDRASPVEVAEAVRIGPYVMPKFSRSDITDAQLNSIIAYVEYAKKPRDAGGWGIDHLGPFPEGMVVWLIAMVVLLAVCRALGKGLSREEGA
jgi:ubiquinol-cytochrome c reductase cytochrome c subunit